MTTFGLRDTSTSTYTTVELVSCLVTPLARAYGSKVDWQQGGNRQINTTGHSTPLAITSVQLNGTGRPVLVQRISVRDEEAAGHAARQVPPGCHEPWRQRRSSFLWPEGRGKAITTSLPLLNTAADTAVLPDLTSASQRYKHDRRT